MANLCKVLQRLETQSGLSEAEYCKKLGIPRSTYRDWKYGQIPRSIQYLMQIIDFHSIPMAFLNQITYQKKGGYDGS